MDSQKHAAPIVEPLDDPLEALPPPDEDGDPFEEFEQELDDEATSVNEAGLLGDQATVVFDEAPEPPYLHVAAGRDRGKDFVLLDGETGVGRGIDNDVILTDLAVSRKHLMIMREGERLTLRDLGSGNGSEVNGQRVDTVTLHDADRIALGETVLTVSIPAEVEASVAELARSPSASGLSQARPADVVEPSSNGSVAPQLPGGQTIAENRPPVATAHVENQHPALPGVLVPKSWFYGVVAICLTLVALLGATVALVMLRPDLMPSVRTTDAEPEASGDAELTSADYLRYGQTAFQTGRWDEAEEAFKTALRKDPKAVEARSLLERVSAERALQRELEQGEAALRRGQYGRALDTVARVPKDSPLRPRAEALRLEARRGLAKIRVDAARVLIATGNEKEARRLLRQARRLDRASKLIPSMLASLDRDNGPERRRRSGSRRSRSGRRRSVARKPTRSQASGRASSGRATGGAISRFKRGDFAGAAAKARDDGQERLAEKIDRFADKYAVVSRASGDDTKLLSELRTAVAFDNQISGGYYGRTLRPRLVNAYLKAAGRAWSGGQKSVACRRVREALILDQRNSTPLRARCEQYADTLVTRASQQQKTNPSRARAIYHEVLSLVPARSEAFKTALNRRSELDRRRRRDADE